MRVLIGKHRRCVQVVPVGVPGIGIPEVYHVFQKGLRYFIDKRTNNTFFKKGAKYATTIGIIAHNANADVNDACSDACAFDVAAYAVC